MSKNTKSRHGHVTKSVASLPKGAADKRVKGGGLTREKDNNRTNNSEHSNKGKVKVGHRVPSQLFPAADQEAQMATRKNGKVVAAALDSHKASSKNEKGDRESIVIWRRPLTTLHYFLAELVLNVREYAFKLLNHKLSVSLSLGLLLLCAMLYHCPGPHQLYMQSMEKQTMWCLYWLGLGVLSSVGLGTGLHTFLLYLGPHIAAVTLAAYECGTLNFASPPYPDSIVCPDEIDEATNGPVNVWTIMSKVRLEAMMWGAGTALGELPPYFMARAARLSTIGVKEKSGRKDSSMQLSDEMAEIEELRRRRDMHERMSWLDRTKLAVEKLVERVGFLGILACASVRLSRNWVLDFALHLAQPDNNVAGFELSWLGGCVIPNPLFDLAGITCGHFLVPFWTFFGATLIGKAIIKTHLQQLTVIVAFNENLVNKAVSALTKVPALGARLQKPLEDLLKTQKAKLHNKGGSADSSDGGGSVLAWLFEKIVLLMVVYFLISIVNSLAQNYHDRLQKGPEHVEPHKSALNGKNRRKILAAAKKL